MQSSFPSLIGLPRSGYKDEISVAGIHATHSSIFFPGGTGRILGLYFITKRSEHIRSHILPLIGSGWSALSSA